MGKIQIHNHLDRDKPTNTSEIVGYSVGMGKAGNFD